MQDPFASVDSFLEHAKAFRPPVRRYSETLRKLAPILAEHVHGAALIGVLVAHEKVAGTESEFDVAEAMYWIGTHYHEGQWCPLYRAMCATEFHPSPLSYGPEREGPSEILYKQLRDVLKRF